jgi:hypothetical protein
MPTNPKAIYFEPGWVGIEIQFLPPLPPMIRALVGHRRQSGSIHLHIVAPEVFHPTLLKLGLDVYINIHYKTEDIPVHTNVLDSILEV